MPTVIGTLVAKLMMDAAQYEQTAGQSKKTAADLGKSLTESGTTLTKGITAPILGAVAAATHFASIGGKYESIRDSFQSMTSDMGISVDKFQSDVAAATGGQLDNLTILQNATKGLSLIGAEAFTDFGADFTKMAELSKKAARATGQDVGFLFESLVTGTARESKMILDNLGITVDITKAKEDYAKVLGVTREEMTTSEEKAAVLQAAIAALEETYGNVSVSAGGFSGAAAEATAMLANMRIEIGTRIAPVMTQLLDIVMPIVQDALPKLLDLVSGVTGWFMSLNPETQKIILGVLGFAAALGPLMVLLGTLITTTSAVIGVALSPLGLAIGAIVAVVALAFLAWKNNWGGIRDVILNFWNTTAKPIFEMLKEWLSVNIPIAIEILTDFWENTLLPAMRQVWSWMEGVLIPFLVNVVYPWLKDKITSALQILAHFWTNTLQPAIATVFNWMSTVLIPFIANVLYPWLKDTLTSALETLGWFWENILLPAIEATWAFIQDPLVPLFVVLWELLEVVGGKALENLAMFWETVLQPALETVWGFIDANIMPILRDLWDFIETNLGPVVKTFALDALDRFRRGLEKVRDAAQWLIDKIKILINTLKGVKVPKAIMAQSPSPFEESLRGISAAMDELSMRRIPNMNAALAGAPSAGDTYQYYLQGQYTMESEQSIVDKLKVMDLLRK